MNRSVKQFRFPGFLKIATYIFLFALCAKGVYLYQSHHPSRESLLPVSGVVKKVRLGGQGKSTWFLIESAHGVHRYSSYYGRVWPGMENISAGDRVGLLAERNRLNKNELIEGKTYYIWEMVHQNRHIIRYQDILELVRKEDAMINRFINVWLIAGFIILFIAVVWKTIQKLRH